jgi:DNA-binding transcriptional MerR regulator
MRVMTTVELCEKAGLSRCTINNWLEAGLLEAEKVGNPGGGCRRVFGAGQLERARLVKMLLQKGVRFPSGGR